MLLGGGRRSGRGDGELQRWGGGVVIRKVRSSVGGSDRGCDPMKAYLSDIILLTLVSSAAKPNVVLLLHHIIPVLLVEVAVPNLAHFLHCLRIFLVLVMCAILSLLLPFLHRLLVLLATAVVSAAVQNFLLLLDLLGDGVEDKPRSAASDGR